MAASDEKVDYEWEFLDPPPNEFDCPICHRILRDPILTDCCGTHFCRDCIQPKLKDGKPCPSCNNAEFVFMLDKSMKRRVFAFDVRCPMWRRGCRWQGELGKREEHMDPKNGDCAYVDVDCSKGCGGRVQRRELAVHLEQVCPQRQYVCDYCPFEATYEVVSVQHWPECENYPLPCPNECGVGTVERRHFEQHLQECPMQEVECDFSYAGCMVKVQRKDMARHMEDNSQSHLKAVSVFTLNLSKDFGKKIQEKEQQLTDQEERLQQQLTNQEERLQQQLKDQEEHHKREVTDQEQRHKQQVTDQEQKMQEADNQRQCLRKLLQEAKDQKNKQIADIQDALRKKDEQLQEKDKQITTLGQKVQNLELKVQSLNNKVCQLELFPLEFVMPNFSECKRVHVKRWKEAPCFYTHSHGYRMQVQIVARINSTESAICVFTVKGDYDSELTWPLKATITLQIIDPTGKNKPCEKSHHDTWSKVGDFTHWEIAHAELQKYIHNDSLQICVVSVKVL